MKVVIKVGSQAILSESGVAQLAVIDNIIAQITQVIAAGHQVVLVSSGAVGLGRGISRELLNREYGSHVADKQLLACIGQPQLMAHYTQICQNHGFLAAQLLLTKYDFQTKRSYINILRLLQKALAQANVLIIVNENDSVAVDELMFTDNDELAGIIAAQIGADKLLLLTSIAGVYDRNPAEAGAQLIKEISLKDTLPDVSGKTRLGRGGMSSKLNTGRKMAQIGVMTHIVDIAETAVISRLILNDEMIGTRVIPANREAARKKFLAFNQGEVQAQITINSGLAAVLADTERSTSILPVGIIAYNGEFKRGDLIEILNPDGSKIGIGVARYNAAKLSEYLGGKNHPPFIHYDYLHLDYDNLHL